MAVGDVPPGRRGNYRCPFCGESRTMESEMIEHRKEGECADKNNILRTASRKG